MNELILDDLVEPLSKLFKAINTVNDAESVGEFTSIVNGMIDAVEVGYEYEEVSDGK